MSAGPLPPTPKFAAPALYRRLLKLYIKKFYPNADLIVKCWKQTKYEFLCNRGIPAAEVPYELAKGNDVYRAIVKGVVPLKRDRETGKPFISIDSETLAANDYHIEPLTPEELLRRSHTKYSPDDVKEIQDLLVSSNRWKGKLTMDAPKLKTKVRTKCTEPTDVGGSF